MKYLMLLSVAVALLAVSQAAIQAQTASPSKAAKSPATAPVVFHSVGVGGGGALYSVSFNPKNPREAWMPTDMGELYHTLDGGASWTYPDMEMLTAHVDSRVQWTNVDGTIYVHEYNGYPAKSTDGGKTWTKLQNWGYFTEGLCKHVRVDPGDANIVFGCSEKAIAWSRDGGKTFKKIWEKKPETVRLWLSGLFVDGRTYFLATTDGLIVSGDGGETWAVSAIPGLPNDAMIASFAAASKDGKSRIWVTMVDPKNQDIYVHGVGLWQGFKGLYRLDIGEKQWTNLTATLPGKHVPGQVGSAANDMDTVWIGGTEQVSPDAKNPGYVLSYPAMLKSSDGGKTWQSTLQWRGNKNVYTDWYGDGHDYDWAYAGPASTLSVCAGDANYAAFTNLFGAWTTDDGGKSWRSLVTGIDKQNKPGITNRSSAPHSSSLNNTASWYLTWMDQNTVFSSSNDITAFRSTDGGKSWQFPKFIGNRFNATYRTIYDAKSGIAYAAMSNAHDLYHGTNMGDGNVDGRNGGIFYSTDKGLTWKQLCAFEHINQGQKGYNPVMAV